MLAALILVGAGVFYFDHKGISFPGQSHRLSVPERMLRFPSRIPSLQRCETGGLAAARNTKASGRDLFSEVLPPPPRAKVPDKVPDSRCPSLLPEPPPPSLPANMEILWLRYGAETAHRSARSSPMGKGSTLSVKGTHCSEDFAS